MVVAAVDEGKKVVMSAECRLVLFARFPVAGQCKTRMIPALGPAGAARLHRLLTERTVAVLQRSGEPVTVAFTGSDHTAFAQWLGPDVGLVEQVDGDLTDRLLACLDPCPVIFFGADTPSLEPRHVTAAIQGMSSHEVVIGPAEDGGYYLIGMREAFPDLLTDMPWSTDQVLPETLSRLARRGVRPLLLETLADCDRPEDLAQWPELVAKCA